MHVVNVLALVAVMASVALAVEIVEAPKEVLKDIEVAAMVPKCKRNKDINRCIRRNLQALIPLIRKGGNFGLPSLEPYHAHDVENDVKGGPIQFHGKLINMTVHGMTEVIVRDARADVHDDSMVLEVDLVFPKMLFKGHFDFSNGVFAGWTFKGRGPFDVTFSDIRATWKLTGHKKPEEKYMNVERLTPNYTVGGMKFWAKGLVDGMPSLDDLVVLMVNRLWTDVVDIGKPVVQKAMSDHLTELAVSVFKAVPYEEIFYKDTESSSKQ